MKERKQPQPDRLLTISITPELTDQVKSIRNEGNSLGKSVVLAMKNEIEKQKAIEVDKVFRQITDPQMQKYALTILDSTITARYPGKFLLTHDPLDAFIKAEDTLSGLYDMRSSHREQLEDLTNNPNLDDFQRSYHAMRKAVLDLSVSDGDTAKDIDTAYAAADAADILKAGRYKNILIETGYPPAFMDKYLELEKFECKDYPDYEFRLNAYSNSVAIFKNIYQVAEETL